MADLSAMPQVNILIVVDVENAMASDDLGSNVYLIDTRKHFGSGNEGQQELYTACMDGQILIWSIASVNPGADAEISGFTGMMVDQNVCCPKMSTLPGGDTVWSARVESQGKTGDFQYSCTLTFDGKQMTFDPFLRVSVS